MMTPERMEELAWRLVATWKDVEMAKLNRPESRYTPGVCEELFLDAMAILKRFNPADIEEEADNAQIRVQDVGLSIRNAGDTVLRGGNSFACITRIDIEQELHVIASARLANARTGALALEGKAEPIERVSGAHFVDFEYPEIWKQWRASNLGIDFFPNFVWLDDRKFEDESMKVMPIILERLRDLLARPQHARHRDNAAAMAWNICNRIYQIEVEIAKVPGVLASTKFHPRREKWTPKVCAEIDAIIAKYNAGKATKIRFSAAQTAQSAACETACYYYGLLTFEQQ